MRCIVRVVNGTMRIRELYPVGSAGWHAVRRQNLENALGPQLPKSAKQIRKNPLPRTSTLQKRLQRWRRRTK